MHSDAPEKQRVIDPELR